MKRTLITLTIATLIAIAGYYIWKQDLIAKLSLPTLESANVSNQQYSAETIFRMNPYGKQSNSFEVDNSNHMMTRQYFQTQFAIISSDEQTLGKPKKYKLAQTSRRMTSTETSCTREDNFN